MFGSVYVVNYIYGLVCIEPALHPQDEAYLIMMNTMKFGEYIKTKAIIIEFVILNLLFTICLSSFVSVNLSYSLASSSYTNAALLLLPERVPDIDSKRGFLDLAQEIIQGKSTVQSKSKFIKRVK